MARKKHISWLLVGDGVRAQFYAIVTALPLRIKAVPAGRYRGSNKKTSELESDRPGISFESVGGARHAIQRRSNAHQREEDKFVGRVAAAVNAAAVSKKFDDIIIVAPPRALAAFRKSFDATTEAKIRRQIRGEWTKLNTAEIEQHLATHLAI
jgi:protein required for attachment to host cells